MSLVLEVLIYVCVCVRIVSLLNFDCLMRTLWVVDGILIEAPLEMIWEVFNFSL